MVKVIIFNDTQNFNGSLNFINDRLTRNEKRFWNYKKYIPFLLEKIKSLDGFDDINLQLIKTNFYEGRYSSNIIKNFEWGCHKEISKINKMISKEQNLLNVISQTKVPNMLRRKINRHVEDIRKDLIKEKEEYYRKIKKQNRNLEGQKKLFNKLESSPLIDIKSTPLKQSEGKIYQKGVDVLLATDLVHLAHTNSYDIAIILSGDTDLLEAVKLIKNLGKIPIIISYHTPGIPRESNISDLMGVGKFINLRELSEEEIGKMSDKRKDNNSNREQS